MNKLPPEILVSIADHLTFTEKLELASVCKSYHEKLPQTTWYKQVTFKYLDEFNQAVEFFNKKGDVIKKTVSDLGLYYMDCNTFEIALQLPTLFPKVTSLVWKDNLERTEVTNRSPEETAYTAALQNWKNIESLVDRTLHLDIANDLLKSTHCDKLTCLEICFGGNHNDNVDGISFDSRNVLHDLIDPIHNAPSLECVHFDWATIGLQDLENLHKSLPRLKSLKLDTVVLF